MNVPEVSFEHDSASGTINIKRIGPYDYFPESYSQNYKFLIWYLGGKIDDNSDNEVIINDNENINIKIYSIIYEIIENIEEILKSLMPTIKIENEFARAQILAIFNNGKFF